MDSKNDGILNFGVTGFDIDVFRISSYDPNSEVSYTFARMARRHTPTFTHVNTRGVMVLGGQANDRSAIDADFFDYKSKCQYKLPYMNHDRWSAGACCIGGTVVICGGYNNKWRPINSCEFYQWTIRKWRDLPNMLEYRAGSAVVSLSNKLIVAIGGRSGTDDTILASVECGYLSEDCLQTELDIARPGFWRHLAPMQKARLAPSAVVLNDKIIVIGGFDAKMMGSVEIFAPPADDASLGQWTTHPFELNQKRNWSTAAIASDGIYIFGSESSPENTVERLQIKFDSNGTVDDAEFERADWELLRHAASFGRVMYAFAVPFSIFPYLEQKL